MSHGSVEMAPSGARAIAFPAEEERQFTSEVGFTIFLGSWAMMFSALFFSYALLRSRYAEWPPAGLPPLRPLLPALATAAIVLSSLVLHSGLRRLRGGRSGFSARLAATFALGAAFLALQVVTWKSLWAAGLSPSTGVFGSIFYLLTMFHGVHVLVGLLLLAGLFVPAWSRRFTPTSHVGARLVARFWHFIAVVWVVTFVSVYLL